MAVPPIPRNTLTDTQDLVPRLLEALPITSNEQIPPVVVQHSSEQPLISSSALILLQRLLEAPPTLAGRRLSFEFVQHRFGEMQISRDDLTLLQTLLETLPMPADGRNRPITLRSVEAHRRLVRAALPTPWLDIVLLRTQQLMFAGALLAAGYWFVDGPLYDWIYKPQVASVTRLSAAAPPAALLPTAVVKRSVLSPSIPSRVARPARAQDVAMPTHMIDVAVPSTVHNTSGVPKSDIHTVTPAPILEGFMSPRQMILVEPTNIPPTPEPTPISTPAPVEPTHLLIPSIGVNTPVVEVFVVDGEWQVADYAAGYMHGTARAGEAGNMAITGHLGLHGSVFANLFALEPGADVFVDAPGWRYHYRTRESLAVWPTQLEVLYPDITTTLTLITCTNWDTQRLVVKADLIGSEPLASQ